MAREIGLDARGVIEHPGIRVWRQLPERDNATLDATLADGRVIRLHLKRHAPTRSKTTPAMAEVAGIRLLESAGIATVPLVGWGRLIDGRSCIVTEDLGGFVAGDRWVREGGSFAALAPMLAELAARLHGAGLHHRDLYLCHWFVRSGGDEAHHGQTAAGAHWFVRSGGDSGGLEVRLIDAGRVRRLPGWPLRRRWIVKDLSQLIYGTRGLPIAEGERRDLIDDYARRSGVVHADRLWRSISRKVGSIARHDAALAIRSPERDVTLGH